MRPSGELLMLLLGCGALLIRVGLGWYGCGMVRSKSAAGAVLRNGMDLAIASLAFWAIGAAIWNSAGRSVFGVDAAFIFDAKDVASSATFIQLVLVLIATAPISAAMAERCKFFPALVAPAVLAAFVVPICAHWVWDPSGWLRKMGFVDIAGASVLHVVGGMTALVGVIVVGPRSGKYNKDGSANMIPGHNMAMASVGVLLILAAWPAYIAGASALNGGISGRLGLNVLLAASAGGIVAVIVSHVRYGKPDIMLAYGGLLGGLVAMSGDGGAVSTIAAVSTGAIAGLIVPAITVAMDLRCKIDDPSGLVAVYLIAGSWGTLATGLFAPSVRWGERFSQFGVQLLGLVVITLFAAIVATVMFAILHATVGLRLSEDAEFDGSDLAEHDVNAYPDFQQTMIKSYHLRQL